MPPSLDTFGPDDHVHLRWLVARDLPTVLRIEREFPTGKDWDERKFLSALRSKLIIGMVAEWEKQVVGYIVYSLMKNHIRLIRLVVDPAVRRKRVGHRIIGKIKNKLNRERRSHLIADVPDDLLPLQLFLKSEGFRATDILSDTSVKYRMVFHKP
jgi:ribosomal protein S18 acetylase RimI-like enzyme